MADTNFFTFVRDKWSLDSYKVDFKILENTISYFR